MARVPARPSEAAMGTPANIMIKKAPKRMLDENHQIFPLHARIITPTARPKIARDSTGSHMV